MTEKRVAISVTIKRFRLKIARALRFHVHAVVPSQQLVRAEVMDAFEQSVVRNWDLLRRLSQ